MAPGTALNPVPGMGHFGRTLPGHFWRAAKERRSSSMLPTLTRDFFGLRSPRFFRAVSTNAAYGSGRRFFTSPHRKHSKPSNRIRSLTSASKKKRGPTSMVYPRIVEVSNRLENRQKHRERIASTSFGERVVGILNCDDHCSRPGNRTTSVNWGCGEGSSGIRHL